MTPAHVDRLHFGIAFDLVRCAFLQQAAVVQHRDALDDTQRDLEIVLDQDETDVRRKRLEKLTFLKPGALEKERDNLWGRAENKSAPSEDEVRQIIAALDDRGAWVQKGRLNYHPDKKTERPIISSATFAKNMDVLSRYVAANASK